MKWLLCTHLFVLWSCAALAARRRTTPEASAAELCQPSSAPNTKIPAFASTLLSLLFSSVNLLHLFTLLCFLALILFFPLLFAHHQKCLAQKGEQILASHIPTLEQLKSFWDPSVKTSFSLWEVTSLSEKLPWHVTYQDAIPCSVQNSFLHVILLTRDPYFKRIFTDRLCKTCFPGTYSAIRHNEIQTVY